MYMYMYIHVQCTCGYFRIYMTLYIHICVFDQGGSVAGEIICGHSHSIHCLNNAQIVGASIIRGDSPFA